MLLYLSYWSTMGKESQWFQYRKPMWKAIMRHRSTMILLIKELRLSPLRKLLLMMPKRQGISKLLLGIILKPRYRELEKKMRNERKFIGLEKDSYALHKLRRDGKSWCSPTKISSICASGMTSQLVRSKETGFMPIFRIYWTTTSSGWLLTTE